MLLPHTKKIGKLKYKSVVYGTMGDFVCTLGQEDFSIFCSVVLTSEIEFYDAILFRIHFWLRFPILFIFSCLLISVFRTP